jgi:putative oxidoreductase
MEIALLGLRLVVGLAFAAHGAQKLFGALGGDGIEGTARSFERIAARSLNAPLRVRIRAA